MVDNTRIVLVTGGARSGKSNYAQNLALSLSSNPVYVATAKDWGGDFTDRINRHKNDRSSNWINYETEKHVSALPIDSKICVIDCVTLWLTNFFITHKNDITLALQDFKNEIDKLSQKQGTFIIVTNEIGMGVHAETQVGRLFTDLQGWANQYVAAKATEVVLMISGIAVTIKKQ